MTYAARVVALCPKVYSAGSKLPINSEGQGIINMWLLQGCLATACNCALALYLQSRLLTHCCPNRFLVCWHSGCVFQRLLEHHSVTAVMPSLDNPTEDFAKGALSKWERFLPPPPQAESLGTNGRARLELPL